MKLCKDQKFLLCPTHNKGKKDVSTHLTNPQLPYFLD